MFEDSKELERRLDNEGYKCLGWANGWLDTPKEVTDCSHTTKYVNHNYRGTDNTAYCEECKWYYKVDSGD